ncbi:MAG: hypothetical protein COW01_02455 [Bdellovibrionales bacterium CG12_big_fil_rev_8_21_14_0_65_38_15]|nr:MAG: hypothetical protein COW79_08120 [Bdellovibrionales bacterium CG22_combo_CG10-13_8_21_14_all_38_13]PIQ56954.1 MAG: hypothetical protein COW01_02455 [Bdellovibrionales bacterium CG12_big_fil_rev_8_21_14_0_65_38_15]PIR29085.1 MAG: hypothetical protein COV38_12665 [Bdellovibrionales bacterium CG11_big_fil_rev_8_21_14_0_20_38_13]
MKNLFFISTILLWSFISFKASAQSQRQLVAFVALRGGNVMKTNGDVIDYVVASKLTDAMKKQLFVKAERDFSGYKQLEKEWAQEKFDLGLKQMAYFEILKKHYLRDHRRGEARRFFNATENAWYSKVEAEESRVLKHLLDQRLGIVKSRAQFGQWLQEQDYPHAANENPTDTYFRWFDALKARLKVEMQMEEVKEYEIAMAVKQNNGRIDASPTDIWNLNEKSQKLISENLDGKNLSQNELDELSKKHPDLLVMVKDIKRLSLLQSKLTELESNDLTKQKITNARNSLLSSLRSKGEAGLLKYIDLASQMKTKYSSSEELLSLAKASLDRFMESGDFNEYMIGRIYKLAAILDDSVNLKSLLAANLNNAIEAAAAFEKGEITFEQAVYDSALAALPTQNDLIAEASSLIAWVMKFEAKKIALADTSLMQVERYEYRSTEAYNRLSNHIKLTRLQDGLKKFRQRDVRDMAWTLDLSNGSDYFTDTRVYNYLMN